MRLDGLVQAPEFISVQAPQLAATTQEQLTITRLAANGARVRKGDVLVEFDRQTQDRKARETRAECDELDRQIGKKRADLAEQDAKNATKLADATRKLALARLEMLKNDMLPRLEAQKNALTLEAADGTIAQLRHALAFTHIAAELDIQILQARLDQLDIVARHAEQNAQHMAIESSVAGLVVYQQIWRGGQYGDPQEGLEVEPGTTLLVVVNPKTLRVRARVNQADMRKLRAGISAIVRLDAYPGRTYGARLVQVDPIATTSQFSDRVRVFTAIFAIQQADAALMPDLSAAVDVEFDDTLASN